MDFAQTFVLAFAMVFVAFIPPGMVNTTALKQSLEHGRDSATIFALGATSVILVQAFLAVTFSQFLAKSPHILAGLSYVAIAIFLALSLFFFLQSRKEIAFSPQKRFGNSYLAGITMASMNMLVIPYFLTYSTMMEAKGWLETAPPHNYIFSVGAMSGAFALYFLYILFADFIRKRVQFVARNINFILSILFLTLALITTYNTLA